jgi:hypothetical protein
MRLGYHYCATTEVAMRNFHYVRVIADEAGGSRFEEARAGMEPADFAPPAPPLDFAALGEAQTVAVIGGDPAWRGDAFHPAPARQFVFMLAGRGSITTSDGDSREFGPGSTFLLEDTHGKGHASRFFDEVIVAVVRLAD